MTCWWDTGPNTDRKRRRKSRVDLKLFKVCSLWKVWTNIVFHAQWGHAEHQPCIILFVILSCPSSCFPTQIDCYVCLIVDLEPFRPTKPWLTHITCPPELPTCLINKDTDSFRQNSQDLIFNFNDWQLASWGTCVLCNIWFLLSCMFVWNCAFALVAGGWPKGFMFHAPPEGYLYNSIKTAVLTPIILEAKAQPESSTVYTPCGTTCKHTWSDQGPIKRSRFTGTRFMQFRLQRMYSG